MIAQPGSPEPTPSTSQQLGKYQLVATLGQGGMGTVYLALASGFGQFRKLLVVKELRQDLTRQPGFVSMFMDEAKLAARLAHPNVVQTFEAAEVDDRYFIAMEYLDGQSLSALLDRVSHSPNSKLTLWMQIQILCDALSGLHYAHELLDYDGSSLQVVHRDVSPQNVFVTYHGQVKVVDFGVAKVANTSVKTAPGVFVGKFSYAAPEQVLGHAVDARTDVFAAGVMLWQAIARRPFSVQAPTPAACRARCEGLEPRIAEILPGVDRELARICDSALAVDPEDRYASAKEFRSELQDYMQRAGVRVEAGEIGQLMHEVFDKERRSLHARIEQAMRHTGVSQSTVDDLSIFNLADKEPTAVADLSSLVEVSLEHDDQKIRQVYAHSHSKVTLVRPSSEQEPVIPMTTFVQRLRSRYVALAGLAVVVLGGTFVAVTDYLSSPNIEIETRESFATVQQPTAPRAAEPVAVPPQELGETLEFAAAAAPSSPPAPATTVNAATVVTPARKEAAAPRTASTPSTPNRYRATRSTPARSTPAAREMPELGPAYVFAPEPAGTQRTVEEGEELPFPRHANIVRIDSENPYQ